MAIGASNLTSSSDNTDSLAEVTSAETRKFNTSSNWNTGEDLTAQIISTQSADWGIAGVEIQIATGLGIPLVMHHRKQMAGA